MMSLRPEGIEPASLEERSPGKLVREVRTRHGLTQKRLAIRAGTTQSAIARIEADRTSPTIKTLVGLFQVMEEDFVFGSRARDTTVDLKTNRKNLELTPTERVQRGLALAEDQRRAAKGEKGRPS
jgi:transcriptional regulator with XRE-family HTH domain